MLRNNGTVQAETIAVQFLPKGTDRQDRRAGSAELPLLSP